MSEKANFTDLEFKTYPTEIQMRDNSIKQNGYVIRAVVEPNTKESAVKCCDDLNNLFKESGAFHRLQTHSNENLHFVARQSPSMRDKWVIQLTRSYTVSNPSHASSTDLLNKESEAKDMIQTIDSYTKFAEMYGKQVAAETKEKMEEAMETTPREKAGIFKRQSWRMSR